MPFPKQIWENLPSEETPINAERLNLYEDYLYDLTKRDVHMIDITPENNYGNQGSGAIYRVGFLAQINITLYAGSATGVFYEMPNGFVPSMNFDCGLIDINNGTFLAGVSYDRVSNMITIQHLSNPLTETGKFSMTYICEE